jgi:hypothetical protein
MALFRSGALSIFRKPEDAAKLTGNLPGVWVPPASPAAPEMPDAALVAGKTTTPKPAALVPGLWVPPEAPPPPPPVVEKPVTRDKALTAPGKKQERPRLVFAVDATASREHVWRNARKLTDALFKALPGELDVALAVHGGGRVHTFTPFTAKPGKLRDMAAGVTCQAGGTRLLDILARVLKIDRVGVVLYIGDAFEESEATACRLADALLAHETRVIILHDCRKPPVAFAEIAERSGGALLPFDASSVDHLGELLGVVAVLAVGGVEAVQEKQATMPAAGELLQKLDPNRLLIGRGELTRKENRVSP